MIHVAVLTCFASSLPGLAFAQLPPAEKEASFLWSCNAVSADGGNISVNTSANRSCDASGTIDGHYFQAVGFAQVAFVPMPGYPAPHANAAASLTVPLTEQFPPLGGNIGMSASGVYQLQIVQSDVPPNVWTQLPIVVSYAIEADANGGASFSLSVPVSGSSINETVTNDSKSESKTIIAPVGLNMTARVSASAALSGFTDTGENGGGQAVADPYFEFDQDEFDKMAGEGTFILADYYEFVFSEGVEQQPNLGLSNQKAVNGIFFDPAKPGHGFDFKMHEYGLTIFYYGHTSTGERLWLISDLYTQEVHYDEPFVLTMNEVVSGNFGNPGQPETNWGTLTVTLNDCDTGTATFDGLDGQIQVDFVRLAGLKDTTCEWGD